MIRFVKWIFGKLSVAILGTFRKKAQQATAEFRGHIQRVRSQAQPLRIELEPSSDTLWLGSKAVQPVVEFLLQSGFQQAGVVAVKGNNKVVMAGFAAPQHSVFASIPKATDHVYLSFVSHFTDGSALECSNMPVRYEPPCPSWLLRQRLTGASPLELWSHFLAKRPATPMTSATVELFAQSNVDDFFRYQAWMAERGGATLAELEVRYRAINKVPAGEEGVGFLAMARSDEIERSLCNWWRLQSDAPFPLEQVMGSLVMVHDELSPGLLINIYWCATNDFSAKKTDFASGSPREAFARVVAQRGASLGKVYEKRTPLGADFYLPRKGAVL